MEHADKSQVFFSIVIPCYNASNSLAITLDSLYEQKFKDFEIVIVDDCSADRDETREGANKFLI
ncbi:glycosyltransferase family 2 protein [Serratia marcescens]|uniref:glycosyltransferase family 2 protein n=1 Tax=Serratia marcescens TaxID=615 RepID=UPI003CFA4122